MNILILGGFLGSGKTSVVGLIDRFYDATSGSVSVNGLDVRQWNEADLRSRVGYVLQEPFLFSRTIAENIRATRSDLPFEALREYEYAKTRLFLLRLSKAFDWRFLFHQRVSG